jgi:hypothetical protein
LPLGDKIKLKLKKKIQCEIRIFDEKKSVKVARFGGNFFGLPK